MTNPYRKLGDFATEHPDQRQAILDTPAYFDPLYLDVMGRCPIVVDIGMKDGTCPNSTVMQMFENISAPEALYVYPELAHSPLHRFQRRGNEPVEALSGYVDRLLEIYDGCYKL